MDAIAWVVAALEPFGAIFIRLISMVVVPLVIASLFTGVASLGDARRLGRIGGRTLVYFLATTILGAIIGTAVALAAGAGAGLDPSVRDAIANRFESTGKTAQSNVGAVPGLMQTLIAIVPQNPIAA
ncbi:MAG: cation:dicarboxylate symporter family transporter, partial [Solimonas sp.]